MPEKLNGIHVNSIHPARPACEGTGWAPVGIRQIGDNLPPVIVDIGTAGGATACGAGQMIGRVKRAAFRARISHNHLIEPGFKAGLLDAILISQDFQPVWLLGMVLDQGLTGIIWTLSTKDVPMRRGAMADMAGLVDVIVRVQPASLAFQVNCREVKAFSDPLLEVSVVAGGNIDLT